MSLALEYRCAFCRVSLPAPRWGEPTGVLCPSCTGLAQRESAIHGACLAMSRFLVWVRLEAEAVEWANLGVDEIVFTPGSDDRALALAHGLRRGLLRMEWPR